MTEIEIYFDVLCPWCYIGKRRLEAALASLALTNTAVRWRSLELDPAGGSVPGPTAADVISQYQPTLAHAEARIRHIRSLGADEGLELNLHLARPVNSLDAHRLIKLADAHGRADAAVERLLNAYHRDALNIADRDVLTTIAAEVGMNSGEARAMLDSPNFVDQVRADEESARARNVRGVPTIIVNDSSPISAVQDPSVLVALIKAAIRP